MLSSCDVCVYVVCILSPASAFHFEGLLPSASLPPSLPPSGIAGKSDSQDIYGSIDAKSDSQETFQQL